MQLGNPPNIDPASLHADLVPLSAELLANFHVAPGDIYFQPAETGKLMLLRKAGDFLEASWKKKWSSSAKLFIRPLVKARVVTQIVELFQDWEEEPESTDALLKLMRRVKHGLVEKGDVSLMSWAYACHEFFTPSIQLQEKLSLAHEILHQRAFYVSSLNVLFSMALGFCDPRFLRDMYLMGWLQDVGLADSRFSYWIALACQEEKRQPGYGVDYLRAKGASLFEVELFLDHPKLGAEAIKNEWLDKIAFPALAQGVLHHHELSDGSGFPSGLNRSTMSDWESLMILSDQLVDYRLEVIRGYSLHGLRELLQVFHRRQVANCPVAYVWQRVGQWTILREEAA